MKKKRRQSKRKTRHHIVPSSRGGSSLEDNICMAPRIPHEKYHSLFVNRRPEEIIDYLVTDFWNGDSKWIDIYLEKYNRKEIKK